MSKGVLRQRNVDKLFPFRTVNIAADHLAPVVPSRGDKVKVILGDEDKDMTGQLLSIDSQVGSNSLSLSFSSH